MLAECATLNKSAINHTSFDKLWEASGYQECGQGESHLLKLPSKHMLRNYLHWEIGACILWHSANICQKGISLA